MVHAWDWWWKEIHLDRGLMGEIDQKGIVLLGIFSTIQLFCLSSTFDHVFPLLESKPNSNAYYKVYIS